MSQYRNSLPSWAITNTVLLFAPIALGLGAFRIWFSPNPAFRIPAFIVFILYYVAVLYICKRTSRAKLWASYRKTNPTWLNYLGTAVGFVMFSFAAFHGFYTVGPALLTSTFGKETTKELTVASAAAVYRSGCRYEIRFNDVVPAIGDGFCVHAGQFDKTWSGGSKVTVHGRESAFGFRVTRIGR